MGEEKLLRMRRWYLWEGGFFAVGRSSGVIPRHAHHAIQITLAIVGEVRAAGPDGEWRAGRGVIVRPDVEHTFAAEDVNGVMLFVDPESAEGAWLRTSLAADVTLVPDRRLETCLDPLRTFVERPLEAMEPGELIRHCVRSLSAGAPPSRRLDPRVASALARIRAAGDLRISLEEAAAGTFLSPGRFAHLFTEHVGLPFRRYLLWRKLTRAMVAAGRGNSLSAAAHLAGFSDAAHFTRTFTQMLGIAPSALLQGEFFEIASPFEPAV